MTFRDYRLGDGEKVLNWINDERAFFLWCADRFDHYPISGDEFDNYIEENARNSRRLILLDGNNEVGHIWLKDDLQNADGVCYFLIIVDSNRRNSGLGKALITLACEFAKENYGKSVASLWVFEKNIAAHNCYQSLGFKKSGEIKKVRIQNKILNYFKMTKRI